MPCARAADDLTFDHHRIDGPAAIVGDDIAEDPHMCGERIDLDLNRVGGHSVGETLRHEILIRFKSRREVPGNRVTGIA